MDSTVADDSPLACDDCWRCLVIRGSSTHVALRSRETTMKVLMDVKLI